MGVYNQAVITNAGEALISAALAGGSAITFSAMQTSSVAIPDGTDLKALTSLPAVAQNIDGRAVNAYALTQNLVQISGRFSNTSIESAYYVQAIAVFAHSDGSDVLVAVVTAVTPDEMPVYNPLSPTALIYNVQLTVQNADTLNISVDDTGTASIGDIARLDEKIAKKITAIGGDTSEAVINSAVPNATSMPIPAAGDTLKVILGKIQKYFADLKKAFTNVSASGRTVTFTAADGSTKQITTQDTTYTAGTGLSLSSGKFNHSNSVTAGTAGTAGATSGQNTLAIPYVTYDAQGHIKASGTHTHTIKSVTADHSGVMTPAMLEKLNGIANGAKVSGVTYIAAGIKEGLASSTTKITTLASRAVSTAGTYLVLMTATCPGTSTSGYLRGVVNTSESWGAAPSQNAFSGAGSSVCAFYVYTISEATTFRALVQQSSGGARDVTWNFAVIRLS